MITMVRSNHQSEVFEEESHIEEDRTSSECLMFSISRRVAHKGKSIL